MPARLSELRANLPPATLADLVEQSIAELTERLALLRQALAGGDAPTIAAEAHAMAGLAASFAMAALEFQLHAIVKAVRDGGVAAAAAVAGDLEAQLAGSAAALRHAVNTEMAQ
jgi:HPt (histidine-containing phosphotransfer) domain-containing protein